MSNQSSTLAVMRYDGGVQRDAVIELWRSVFRYDSPHNEPSLVLDQKAAVDDGLLFVAVDGLKIVGTIMAGYDGHRGWLYSLAVLPEFRHAGTGSALVRHAEQALLRRGCLKINLQVVESNAAVVAFYETLGYEIEPRISMGRRVG